MSDRKLRAVGIGDIHDGSLFAVADLNDEAVPRGGPGKDTREALFEIWRTAVKGEWGQPDVLIVNADCVDGQNRKQGGVGTWTTDLYQQADNCASLIKMWGAKAVYMTRGSNYHVGAGSSGMQVEEYIARRVGAVEVPHQGHISKEARDRSGWDWYIHLGCRTFHVAHKIAVSKVFHYQTTPTARQLLQAKLNDRMRNLDREKLDDALQKALKGDLAKYRTSVVLRSHAHYYNWIEFSGSEGGVLPCWKALDEFMLSNGPLDISPDIGFVGFTIKENGIVTHEKNLWPVNAVQSAPLSIVEFPGKCAGRSRRIPGAAKRRSAR